MRCANSKQSELIPASQPEFKPEEVASELIGAVNLAVHSRCEELANAMVTRAIAGDANHVRFLTELTGAKTQCSQPPKRQFRQLLPWTAEDLVAQPPWPDPSKPEVDTGFGGKEPEN